MRNRPLCTVCLVVFILMSGMILTGGSRFLEELRESPLETYQSEGDSVRVRGTLYDVRTEDDYQALYLKDNVISSTGEKRRIYKESRILVYLEKEQELSVGNQIQIKGTLKFFQKARNPGNFDQKLYYQKQKIHGMVWAETSMILSKDRWLFKNALHRLRQNWKESLIQSMGEKDGKILSAMLLGEKHGMDQETKDLYQANGISHILAISSLHLTFVGGTVYRRIRKLSGSYPVGGVVGGLFLAMYILMIGFTVSAVRALVMFLFRVGADVSGRKYDAPTAYVASAVVVLLWRPLSLYDGGFWMSFGAIGAILFVYPVVSSETCKIREAFLVSMSIQLVLLPIQLWCFYEIQPISLLMNLLVIPMMSVLLTAGMVGSFLVAVRIPLLKVSGDVVLGICRGMLKICEEGCRRTLVLPGARIITGRPEKWSILFYALILLAGIWLCWHKKKRAVLMFLILVAGIALMSIHPKEWGKLRVTFLDVGQGDCIYIRSPSGTSCLVDGGSSDVKNAGRYRMEPYLKYRGVRRLEYVFVSHGDADHINGIRELLERKKIGVEIGTLVLPERFAWNEALKRLADTAKKQKIPVAVMRQKGQVREKGFQITCLGPEDMGGTPGNETSMILAVQSGLVDVLLTGDVEGQGEVHLQEVLEEKYADVRWEILKAAHHGSKNSSKEAFLEVVRPMETVISAGVRNRYGHPHKETIGRLKNVGSKIRSTKEQGAVEYLLEIF